MKSAASVTSTIASQRKREVAEANQQLIELEKEQQLAEEELHRQNVALELSKHKTEEGRKIAALNQARAEKAERLAAKTENIATNTPGEDIMSYNHSLESNELLIRPPSQTPPNPQSKQHRESNSLYFRARIKQSTPLESCLYLGHRRGRHFDKRKDVTPPEQFVREGPNDG